MKSLAILLLVGSSSMVFAQSLNSGDHAGHLIFHDVKNGPRQAIRIDELKGKVVLLEFWTTWCGPCLPAMEHLEKLKAKYSDDLEVIAILLEPSTKLDKYLGKKSSSLWHVSDTTGQYGKLFNFRFIPHTVVINHNGAIIGATSPMELTEDVMGKLVKNQHVDLKIKDDGPAMSFDLKKDYFPPDSGTTKRFLLQPKMDGGMSLARDRFAKDGSQTMRKTMINLPLSRLFQHAYNIRSDALVVYENTSKEELSEKLFCVDVVAPSREEFFTYFQQELNAAELGYTARLEKRKVNVKRLEQIPGAVLTLEKATTEQGTQQKAFVAANGYFLKNKSINDFVIEYLNVFIAPQTREKFPIINGTNNLDRFNWDFEIDLSDPGSFKRELKRIGLQLVDDQADQEVLIIRKDG